MAETSKPEPDFFEVMGQNPELFRAWELFISLLKDDNPFLNLGYNSRQIRQSRSILSLVGEPGQVKTREGVQYLSFEGNDGWVVINPLPYGQGFYLVAAREPGGISETDRVIQSMMISQHAPLEGGLIAKIALFYEPADTNNLDYLIPKLYPREELRASLARANPATRALGSLGLVTTYEAAWVDPGLQLAVHIHHPNYANYDPEYHIWRVLDQVSDEKGRVTPIGLKANVPDDTVRRILSASKEGVVRGRLALEQT